MPDNYILKKDRVYECEHPLYDSCTLYLFDDKGLAVVQTRFNPEMKTIHYGPIDPWLADDIYAHERFRDIACKYAAKPKGDIYPTIHVRKLMWELRMKPLKRQYWEKAFSS